jgi:predicted thioesterase
MKALAEISAQVEIQHVVVQEDTATFETGEVHPVYSTFSLTREAEWCTRQFVLEMKEEGEEGIGTYVNVQHKSPAFIGQTVVFKGLVDRLEGNHLHCHFQAFVGDRVIAEGETGQKILKKEKLNRLFDQLKHNG